MGKFIGRMRPRKNTLYEPAALKAIGLTIDDARGNSEALEKIMLLSK